jgi:hypothetical protein
MHCSPIDMRRTSGYRGDGCFCPAIDISIRHWQPDHQLRLCRIFRRLLRFNNKAHEPSVIAGQARFPADCSIEDWDYLKGGFRCYLVF